jgi:CubicO group peptidase (beta-lactamase class C family)
MAPDTIFDLASLTKVLATTAMAMLLLERGKLDLEMPAVSVLPEFAGDLGKEKITLRMLLAHRSGLPAHAKLYECATGYQHVLGAACAVEPEAEPGTKETYSDIGFILLGELLTRLARERLDQFCQREIFAPLGMNMTQFNPPMAWKSNIPPTVEDKEFRGRVVQGEVHDENASAMGGVAGQAGLFAPVLDVAKFARCMLRGGAPVLKSETVGMFTTKDDPLGSYALGWDTPSVPSQSGKYFSPHSFGHLGYTGTSLWIDPERQLAVVLLTNRTWPDATNQKIKEIRPAFHDAIVEALR